MTFSTDHKTYVITEAMRFRQFFMEKPKEIFVSILHDLFSQYSKCHVYVEISGLQTSLV